LPPSVAATSHKVVSGLFCLRGCTYILHKILYLQKMNTYKTPKQQGRREISTNCLKYRPH
jgi:hypothetical protein